VNYKNGYNYYYFCGDFADNPISYASSRFRYIQVFSPLFYSSSENERASFFWKYYRPLLRQILNEYISPQKNRAVKNKSYFCNCYGKEKKFDIKNQG